MATVSTYSTGTVAIGSGATSVVGTGPNWTGSNAMSGDLLVVGGNTVIVQDVTDALHLAIDAWPFAAITAGTAYKIYKVSPLRFVGAATAVQVDQMVTALDTNGLYVFVPPNLTEPDPSLGQDDQYAFQATTGKLWEKTSGTWNFIGIFKGFGLPAAWDSATAYVEFDVVSLAGTSYVCILANTNEMPSFGDSPANEYWIVLAQKGDTGATGSTGATGAGYGGTSATSFAVGTGSKAFTTQAGLAYQVGNYVRASSAAGGANFVEGPVTSYSGTTLTINVTKTGGTGTHTDWNFQVAGAPGTGDLLSTNNLSDLASAATARTNLGLGTAAVRADTDFARTDTAQSLTAAQRTQVRSNISSPLRGHLWGLTLSTAGGSGTFGIAVGEAADSTAVSLMALGSAYTKTTSSWAVGTAAGALDTGTIAISTWYHVHLIQRPDTGVVDVLISLSATAPTLPTNYTLFRRIGSILADGSSHWYKFVQLRDQFLWDIGFANVNASTGSTAIQTATLATPAGIQTDAIVYAAGATGTGTDGRGWVFSPDVNSGAATISAVSQMNFGMAGSAGSQYGITQLIVRTNTSSQVKYAMFNSNGSAYITTVGWIDNRGQN